MAVARMETCEDVGELARELGVRPRCLYKWRRKLEMVEPGQEASRPSTHASAHRKEIAGKIGDGVSLPDSISVSIVPNVQKKAAEEAEVVLA